MFQKNNSANPILQGIQSVNLGIWGFGFALITFATLLFLFPALIGYIFATLIFFIGVTVLYLGFRFWQFKNHLKEWEVKNIPTITKIKTDGPNFSHRRVTIVMR